MPKGELMEWQKRMQDWIGVLISRLRQWNRSAQDRSIYLAGHQRLVLPRKRSEPVRLIGDPDVEIHLTMSFAEADALMRAADAICKSEAEPLKMVLGGSEVTLSRRGDLITIASTGFNNLGMAFSVSVAASAVVAFLKKKANYSSDGDFKVTRQDNSNG